MIFVGNTFEPGIGYIEATQFEIQLFTLKILFHPENAISFSHISLRRTPLYLEVYPKWFIYKQNKIAQWIFQSSIHY